MRIATLVKGYITAPSPKDIVYAPIDLAMHISQELVKRGHMVDFFGPEGSRIDGVNVVTCNLHPLVKNYGEYHDALINPAMHSDNVLATWDQYLASEMFRRAHEGVYDLLHFHHPEVALPFVRMYPNVPVVYTLHDPIEPLQREVLKLHTTPHQYFISISHQQRKTAPELNYLATIYNGVDTEQFTPSNTPRDDYLLFLGSILPTKGAKEAVEVAKKTNSNLLIIGPTYPDHHDYYRKYVAAHLNDKIRYIGPVAHEQTLTYFQKAKAFLMPIQWEEPFGLTMIEAMACGTPVIALRRGSVPEIITHNQTGFIANTVTEMAKAVKHIETIKPETCRSYAVKHFSMKRMVDDYEEVFWRILA